MRTLMNLVETSELIKSGANLLIAGHQSLLEKLPAGNWIGGSIPYFMSERGGTVSLEELQVVKLPDFVKSVKIKNYSEQILNAIPSDYATNGVSVILIPAGSKVLQKFAVDSFNYHGLFDRPLIGWVTGVHLSQLDKEEPCVFNGNTQLMSTTDAVVMHIELPENKIGKIDIINLFKPGAGDIITFPETGFEVVNCFINGKSENFYDYIQKTHLDIQLPMVANYNGAMVNVSFQSMDEQNKLVRLYAPVVKGIEYKLSRPIHDYEKEFAEELARHNIKPAFTCNCILNFLYANLEGKKSGDIVGPITFGEIAYILLNQTMVYLAFQDAVDE